MQNLFKNLIVIVIVGLLLVGLFSAYNYVNTKFSEIKNKRIISATYSEEKNSEKEKVLDVEEKYREETLSEKDMVLDIEEKKREETLSEKKVELDVNESKENKMGKVVITKGSAFLLDENGKPVQKFRHVGDGSYLVYKITENGEEYDGTAKLVSTKYIGGTTEESYRVYDKDGNLKKEYNLYRK